MGVVHAAHDPELDRRIAVKLMHDAAWSPHLLREAQALARLAHPNVVTVYDIGDHGGRVFIAMELVSGATLARWLAARPRTWREIVDVFLQAGRGLAAAHAAGYVHRDFKPDNVLVGEDGRARVSDFGLACLETSPPVAVPPDTRSDAITRTSIVAGTPAYMAPEQLDGAASDARADQFAFCVALFEALHGTRPFAGETVGELRAEIERGVVRRGKRVPARVERVVRRGLAADPRARYADMPALLAALERTRSRRVAIAAAAAVALGGIALVAWRMTAPTAATCRGADAEIAAIWNPTRKLSVESAFAATSQAYARDAVAAVEKALDRYAHDWATMHDDACHAKSDALDLRMQCLAERRAELAATVTLFAAADASVVERAARIASALTPVASCADVAALRAGMPVPPQLRAQLAEQARTLAAVRVLDSAKRFTEARPQVEAAVTRAVALHFPPAEAEARYLAGSVARRDGDLPAADAHLRAAVRAAEAGRADALRADALVELLAVQTTWQHLDAARQVAGDAAATVQRIGGGRAAAKLELALGDLTHDEGKADDALTHYRAALDAQRRSGDEFAVATALKALGSLYIDMGKNVDAEQAFRESHAITTRLLGRAHPDVANALAEIAESLRRQHKHDEALRVLHDALTVAETAHAHEETLVLLLDAIADVTLDADRPRDALPFLDRAYALLIHGNRKRTALLNTVRLQGECALTLERYDAALAKFTEAKQLIVEKKGEENVDIAFAEEAIASVYEHQGKYKLAVAALEHSLALQLRDTPDHLYLATTRFALARSLWPAGDRKRARELADQARATWAENGDTAQAGDAAAWLKSH